MHPSPSPFASFSPSEPTLVWKPDWPRARQAHTAWWHHKGMAVAIYSPADKLLEDLPAPAPNPTLETIYLDPRARTQRVLYGMSRNFYGGAAFPYVETMIGPGSLGMFLGCGVELASDTVWYHPNIVDPPENHPPLRFDPNNVWFQHHLAITKEAHRQARGRYLVGFPDLIENLDILAQLRGSQNSLMDLIERPDWCRAKIREINQVFFDAYDALLPYIRDAWGGTTFSAFNLWAPGKVAKVQCDFSCMISPDYFRTFVLPGLAAQCQWLDYSMYHLDGTQAMQHLNALLDLEPLDAIEWTPQAGLPGGGSPQWYDFYRQIKRGGKSVQAVGVKLEEILPLIDAVGPEGLYIMSWTDQEEKARKILEQIGWQ